MTFRSRLTREITGKHKKKTPTWLRRHGRAYLEKKFVPQAVRLVRASNMIKQMLKNAMAKQRGRDYRRSVFARMTPREARLARRAAGRLRT